ncbi:hypothetical protein ACM66B_004570 [Microbotryomycetes sp. NB124-2]
MTRVRVHDSVLHPSSFDKHRIMGVVVVGLTFLQVAIGYGMHLRHTNTLPFETRHGHEFAARRTWVNWLHILLGLSLLTLAGITATWAFVDFKLEPKPTWVQVLNWCLVGLPAVILAPIILWRGYRRLKTGHTFAQAFLNAPIRTVDFVTVQKGFFNEADYLVEAAVLGRHAPAPVDTGEQGFAYAPGRGSEGRQFVNNYSEPGWQGVATREDYELGLRTSTTGGEILYDAPPLADKPKFKQTEPAHDTVEPEGTSSVVSSIAPSLPPIEPLFASSTSSISSKSHRVPVPDLVAPLSPASPLELSLPPPPQFPVVTSRSLSPPALSNSSSTGLTSVERTPSLSVVGSDGHEDGEQDDKAESEDARLQREASGRWFGNRRS